MGRMLGGAWRAASVGTMLGATLTVGLAAAAYGSDPTIDVVWGTTSHVAWDASEYSSVQASFVGDRVVTPGDVVTGTITVTNSGPGIGWLNVYLTSAHQFASGEVNSDLAQGIDLLWQVETLTGRMAFAEVDDRIAGDGGQGLCVAALVLDRGQDAEVTFGFTMPVDVDRYAASGQPSHRLVFTVDLLTVGDVGVQPDAECPLVPDRAMPEDDAGVPPTPPPTPSAPASPSPVAGSGPGTPSGPGAGGTVGGDDVAGQDLVVVPAAGTAPYRTALPTTGVGAGVWLAVLAVLGVSGGGLVYGSFRLTCYRTTRRTQ